MDKKDLRRLSRRDLLEMLLELSKENEKLRKVNEQLEERLEDRTINILKSDSLAEAALRLNGVFEAAQNACDQYIFNTQMRCRKMEEETRRKCSQMLRDAECQEYNDEAEDDE
jgi:hypothetical protein